MTHEYHDPVLLHDSVNGLAIRPEGVYVDATFGGGGHGRAILERLGPSGSLIAFDRDPDAVRNAPEDPRFTLVRSDFRWIRNHLRYLNKLPVDGLLADLGVSSHQFDTAERGFSIRFDGPLDMRMDQGSSLSAAELLRTTPSGELATLLKRYGEVEHAGKVARTLTEASKRAPITTTAELVSALAPVTPRKDGNSFLARVFQALRIAVNGELDALLILLQQSPQIIRQGGRLVVISYHSLEDRMVKNWMRAGDPSGEERKDMYGNRMRPFDPIHSKAIKAKDEEIERNPRARSARLRIAERT